jgi:predicted negative regulator of RcsB-dependent stress response
MIRKDIGEMQGARSDFQKAAEFYQKQGRTQWYQFALNQLKQVP